MGHGQEWYYFDSLDMTDDGFQTTPYVEFEARDVPGGRIVRAVTRSPGGVVGHRRYQGSVMNCSITFVPDVKEDK